LRFSNIDILYQPIQRVAPYGIFPFDEQTCFDLITGEVFICTTFNLRHLQDRYRQSGLVLELYPPITKDDIEVFMTASMGEKKKFLPRYDLSVRDGEYVLPRPRVDFCPVFVEFLHEETVIEADRQRIDLLRTSNISK